MSNAFMKLHDFALGQGLLDKVPELAQQLRETTEKFLSLARRSSEDESKDESQATSHEYDTETRDQRSSPLEAPTSSSPEAFDKTIQEQGVAVTRSVAPFGGYIVSHEPSFDAAIEDKTISPFMPSPPTMPESGDYEIIAQPTLENASFPFAFPGNGSPLSGYLNPSPYNALAGPDSFSPFEVTFGRRLQRKALEQAFLLVTHPSPDPVKFAKVFGFCMAFESVDKIKERLYLGLRKGGDISLNDWAVPFLHLGGAGTRFPDYVSDNAASNDAGDRSSAARIGNEGLYDPLRPRFQTGFSTGPFNERVTEVRDSRLDESMRMLIPGFDGRFFDCDDTELYLRQRGVYISPLAETVVAEVDMDDFQDSPSNKTQILDHNGVPAPNGLFGPSASELAAVAGLHGIETAASLVDQNNLFLGTGPQSVSGGGQPQNNSSLPDSDISPFILQHTQFNDGDSLPVTSAPSYGTDSVLFPLTNAVPLSKRKQIVTIHVPTFIKGMFIVDYRPDGC
jgi:hypothetical protein